MMKRILFAAAVAVLVAGCGSSRDNSSSSGSTGAAGSNGTSGSGSTGGSTGTPTCTNVPDINTLRTTTPADTYVCVNNVVTVLDSSFGDNIDGGYTKYDGKYFVADAQGNMVEVYKSKKSGPLTLDPTKGNVVNVKGYFGPHPSDGGQLEISGKFPLVDITAGTGTVSVPAGDTAALADISDSSSTAELGRYVLVPAGTYTQDNAAPELQFPNTSPGGGPAYQDGFALVSGSNRVLVETYTFKFNNGGTSCPKGDGGFGDFTGGNFHGVVDTMKGGDGKLHKVVFVGGCVAQ